MGTKRHRPVSPSPGSSRSATASEPSASKENVHADGSPPRKRHRVDRKRSSEALHELLKQEALRSAEYQEESLRLQRDLVNEVRRANEEYVASQRAYLELLKDKL